jgi:hypothetical protein
MRHRLAAAVVAASLVVAGCSAQQALPKTAPSSTTTSEPLPPPATTTTTTWPTGSPGWTVASVGPRGITAEVRTVTVPSGRTLTAARFPAATTAFHVHVGYQDPPGASSLAPGDASSSVSTTSAESNLLVAAFNGGFKQNAAAGGMEVDGIVVSPMSNGFAAAVVDRDGSLHVGLWGRDYPKPGEDVVAVRENLGLLVENSQATAAAMAGPGPWGAVLGPNPVVARSSLGVDAQGNVIYVASTAALPSDLAAAQVQLGAVTAMQLDINPSWITLGVARGPGQPMTGMIPGQYHDPSIYLRGWERDFFAVLARPSSRCRLIFPAPAGVATADPPIVRCGGPHVHTPTEPYGVP